MRDHPSDWFAQHARRLARAAGVAVLVLSGVTRVANAQAVRPGIWAGSTAASLPLPVNGSQVYIVGEMHGLEENETIAMAYLAKLHDEEGLRDVVIEEDAVYQQAAADYVAGGDGELPTGVCLRAGVLEALRSFNQLRMPDQQVRVHLVDIDSPASSIRQHLQAVQAEVDRAKRVLIPEENQVAELGVPAVEELSAATRDPNMMGELRTIRYSIGALRQGFAVGIGPPQGSPYMEDREQAVASNIQDLLARPDVPSLLVLYGADHASKSVREDGGANRDETFEPMALRLEAAGVKVLSLVTFPLSGQVSWRGRRNELLWSAVDGTTADGEAFDLVLDDAPGARFLYIDRGRNPAHLPSQDLTAMKGEAFVVFDSGTPMRNLCPEQP